MRRSIKICHRDGRIAYREIHENYGEALLAYAGSGGDLRSLDHSNRDLSHTVFPASADMSGSDFTGSKINWSRFDSVNFTECTFSKTMANNNQFTNCSFVFAEILKSNFSDNSFSDCSMSKSVINNSSFRNIRSYKMNFAKSTASAVDFSNAGLHLACFAKSRMIDNNFSGAIFSTTRFSGSVGERLLKRSKLPDHKNDKKTVTWLASLYADAEFIGCKYTNTTSITTAAENFPREIFHQRRFFMGSKIAAAVVGLEGFDRLTNVVENYFNNPEFQKKIIYDIVPYVTHLSAGSLAIIGGSIAVGSLIAAEMAKEKFNESVEDAAMTRWRRMLTIKSRTKDMISDLSKLVIVAGKYRTVEPIVSALMSIARDRGNGTQSKLLRSVWSITSGDDRIVICSRDDLTKAMSLLHNIECKTTFPFDHAITIIPDEHPNANTPMAISMRPDRRIKAIWHIREPGFSGYLMQSWEGSEKRGATTTRPALSSGEIENLLSRHAEIGGQIVSGPGACMRAMISALSVKAGEAVQDEAVQDEAVQEDGPIIPQNDSYLVATR